MDTKWKTRKKAISFLLFFAGATITLGGLAGTWKNKPVGAKSYLLDSDYQKNPEFRSYMANRLENFIVMATGGGSLRGFYYDSDYATVYSYATATAEAVSDYSIDQEAAAVEGDAATVEADYAESGEYRDDVTGEWISGGKPLTEEEIKKAAENYDSRIKGDKNLLYTVSYDGEVLYSNWDLKIGGAGDLPEGYNFFLEFDGEKVKITKDGEELDIYGDGYYREGGSLWYVPGYKNFPVDDKTKRVTVCMAAAKCPALYTEGAYGSFGSWQSDNTLYWMYSNFVEGRAMLARYGFVLAFGICLLFLAFRARKTRAEAWRDIGRLQAKIWVEFKILYFVILFALLFDLVARCGTEYGLWQEWTEIAQTTWTDSSGSPYVYETAALIGHEFLGYLPGWFWMLLFWGVVFLWNDLRYNRKTWGRGLVQKICRIYSAKNLTAPISLKMARRNRGLCLAGALYGPFVIGTAALGMVLGARIIVLLFLLGTAAFVAVWYVFGKKGMELARDMDTLIHRVSQIREGNYAERQTELAGHDLDTVMEQLEDIRHGIAQAVDEQMKSERMKVELIANVSHDIKTPLTSIISYVEFLKQEEDLPPHVKDYVKILDEKSQRLKNMVMDVFEVSKAASGELPVHMEELDFGKLLRQTLADMQEEIEKSLVSFRTQIPEEPVMILADGQRMYRVFQNLFQNAIKYSLEGSRVYVSLALEGKTAVSSVKNTSQMEIKKDRDFTERFVRGDESRTDGGSGLGLSIAQSFTEACGGEFSWEVDADLFVVKVSFQGK